ncbi:MULTISPECIES: YqzM family protein [Paenibacillus]|nr:YqzM family protein [Paenibacillus caseinilyticus]MCZ8522393.1 YqzM family protein [Paenibacillus caseinilyticus]
MTNDSKHPELHVYEEGRDDLMDTAIGFGVFFGALFLMGIAATIISLLVK